MVDNVRQPFTRSRQNQCVRRLESWKCHDQQCTMSCIRGYVSTPTRCSFLMQTTARRVCSGIILAKIDVKNYFLGKIRFSDESTFHISGKLNRHNVRTWGSESPDDAREMERDSPNVNVWCGLLPNCIIGPFFFSESTISSDAH
ncbi:hypothetical protein AVEN_159408-1 [Araneus ventricosus]|uniref:Uncharacterized protein n=1 Tax=Araneus ventricosus TaxID=182803 RepID=A0A4Y2A335_ARAVE|nr:hypothetical protein AVEN_159408-1 [Araneus ventricosus]